MVKAEVTRADHQRLIDSVESESSVALLVHFREVTWSRIWDQALEDMETFMISCTDILRSSRTMHMDMTPELYCIISYLSLYMSILNPFLYRYAISLWAWQ